MIGSLHDHTMDNNDEEFFLLLQLMLAEQKAEAGFQDELLACVGLVCYRLEEAHWLRVLKQSLQQLYLTHPDLFPNPCIDTPWKVLYHSQNDRALWAVMLQCFCHGFERLWNETPIPCCNVPASSVPRVTCHSLDAVYCLGTSISTSAA